jgi:hypothetical protein
MVADWSKKLSAVRSQVYGPTSQRALEEMCVEILHALATEREAREKAEKEIGLAEADRSAARAGQAIAVRRAEAAEHSLAEAKRLLKAMLSNPDKTSREQTRRFLAQARTGWRDMESAPRNGDRFLAFEKGRYFDCWWQDKGYGEAYWMDEADSEPNPSAWQPLPSAPKGGRDNG